MKKATLAKGTRDFLPLQSRRRKFIFETIEKHFVLYGYQPLETPAMENLETLMGKYGDEGDKLLFKILNSGDFLKSVDEESLSSKDVNKLANTICEKGLRYDLTVPFARVVAMNQNEIHFPFKRYQIQPVWRADRPQRGRYREFYQCDADVVGSRSLLYEAELIQIYDKVFAELGIPVNIHLNHRSILEGIAMEAGIPEKFMEMTIEIDKLDKTGPEALFNALKGMGASQAKCEWILSVLNNKNLDDLCCNEVADKGVSEIKEVLEFNKNYKGHNALVFDPALARGLSYYTGCIFEVKPNNFQMGSLGGGGRYDDLTAVFGLKGVSGVGISFGADRIYDVLSELNLFPSRLGKEPMALFCALDQESLQCAFEQAGILRTAGIPVEVFPEAQKLKKQFQHAEKLAVPYVIIIGEEEVKMQSVNLKNQSNGEQSVLKFSELIEFFVKML
ncbi:MAG: histidine--tRNA ligase [Saprospiraceae bacterium]|nr:histidine--tRNA ligase [Saprospiraceae bacterium]